MPTTVHDLHLSGQIDSWSVWSVWSSPCCRVWAVKSAKSRTCFLGWICTIQSCATSQNGKWGYRLSRSRSLWSICPTCTVLVQVEICALLILITIQQKSNWYISTTAWKVESRIRVRHLRYHFPSWDTLNYYQVPTEPPTAPQMVWRSNTAAT